MIISLKKLTFTILGIAILVTGLVSQAMASTCFFKYEYEEAAGMNKICYYDCVTGTYAITIDFVALCPLTTDR